MSSEEQRKMEFRQLMTFPPIPSENEHKLHIIKFNLDNGSESQLTHWTLKRAGPPMDMIDHAMNFNKSMDSVVLGNRYRAALNRRTLAATALTAFDVAHTQYMNV